MNNLSTPQPTTASPRPEYPRPHFDRSHSWVSCNGLWDFAAGSAAAHPDDTEQSVAAPDVWDQQITVPFSWETAASGIGAHWLSEGWYRRRVDVPAQWQGRRLVLHFGAVHHQATVWVDGAPVGTHVGGYLPFEIDITDAVTGATITVLVRVQAPIDKRSIAHGKQRSVPRDDYDDCAFAPSSGIWQSVWLEARPATYLTTVKLTPSKSLDGIDVAVQIGGNPAVDGAVELTVVHEGEELGEPLTTALDGRAVVIATLPIADPKLWCPSQPHLYHVRARLHTAAGTDEVTAYTGLRSIEVVGTEILLNSARLYVRGVLDQGYWPDSGITAPTDQAYITDLELARKAGFNLVRKHLKTEDPRFLHHADRLGMLVWAEPASTGRFTPRGVAAFEAQIQPMVHRDHNHPCIAIWGLYNEEWGLDWDVPGDTNKQDAVRRAFHLIKQLDPTRPAVDNSGWAHVETDLLDWHIYTSDPTAWRSIVRGVATGELTEFPVHISPEVIVHKAMMATPEPHRPVPNLNSEYGGGFTSAQRGWNLRWQTQELRRHDTLSGYVYTELYDIEHEMAGIYTQDRQPKDLGGADPAWSNADTTLVLNLDPIQPGIDLRAAGQFDIGLHLSHHGPAPIQGTLTFTWLQPMTPLTNELAHQLVAANTDNAATTLIPVTAKPFQLSQEYRITTTTPAGMNAGRLALIVSTRTSDLAAAVIDVENTEQFDTNQSK